MPEGGNISIGMDPVNQLIQLGFAVDEPKDDEPEELQVTMSVDDMEELGENILTTVRRCRELAPSSGGADDR